MYLKYIYIYIREREKIFYIVQLLRFWPCDLFYFSAFCFIYTNYLYIYLILLHCTEICIEYLLLFSVLTKSLLNIYVWFFNIKKIIEHKTYQLHFCSNKSLKREMFLINISICYSAHAKQIYCRKIWACACLPEC